MILQSSSHLKDIPKRIISLVPSQTELLHYLGLEEETVGVTKFCIHPKEWFNNKPKIGGTKNINISAIKKLQPDLIIANKEENVMEKVEALAADFNVLVTDVNSITDALQMIQQIGYLTGKEQTASTLITKIKNEFSKIIVPQSPIKTAYLIWNDPYMAVGNNTFINNIIQTCGLQNIFTHKNRYPEITIAQLSAANCQLILLSSEPYPFKQKHVDELQRQLPEAKVILADGEMFSWYGSRMLYMPAYLKRLIAQIKH